MSWLYRYVLREDLKRYERYGYRYICDRNPKLGGHDSIIIRRKGRREREWKSAGDSKK